MRFEGLRWMLLLGAALGASLAGSLAASEESLTVYVDRRSDPVVAGAATALRDAGRLMGGDKLLPQLSKVRCQLRLPARRVEELPGRQIWELARKSYLRIGWYYLCKKCERWHVDLAGGYALTEDGVAATCHHVLEQPPNYASGFIIAATDAGKVFAVTEILAANARSDVAIVRLAVDGPLTPLPLSEEARPGDTVYCFSDPMNYRGYFSRGIVNRFHREAPKRRAQDSGPAPPRPLGLHVSTDWAPGSSGAAILDEYGNAIGHVARILPIEEEPKRKASADKPNQRQDTGTLMVLHEAVPAQEVLGLIDRQ